MSEEMLESMLMLFSAKWNVPRAAEHCGLTIDEMKTAFAVYCQSNPATYSNEFSVSTLRGRVH